MSGHALEQARGREGRQEKRGSVLEPVTPIGFTVQGVRRGRFAALAPKGREDPMSAADLRATRSSGKLGLLLLPACGEERGGARGCVDGPSASSGPLTRRAIRGDPRVNPEGRLSSPQAGSGEPQGLYDPALAKASCGVGFIADIKGRVS